MRLSTSEDSTAQYKSNVRKRGEAFTPPVDPDYVGSKQQARIERQENRAAVGDVPVNYMPQPDERSWFQRQKDKLSKKKEDVSFYASHGQTKEQYDQNKPTILSRIRGSVVSKGKKGIVWGARTGYNFGKDQVKYKVQNIKQDREYRRQLEREARDYRIRTDVEARVNSSPVFYKDVQTKARKHALSSSISQREYNRISQQGYESPWERANRIRRDRTPGNNARRATSDTGYVPKPRYIGIQAAQNAINRARSYATKAKPISPKGSHGREGYEIALKRAKSWISKSTTNKSNYVRSGASGYNAMMAKARATIK